MRARRLPPEDDPDPGAASEPRVRGRFRRRLAWWIGASLVIIALFGLYRWQGSRGTTEGTAGIIQTVTSGDLRIALVSATGSLRPGRNEFQVEFRDAEDRLVDAGIVKVTAAMPMPGMVMSGGVQVQPSGTAGRYNATGEFGMAGAWQFSIEWNGNGRQGSAAFEGAVR
ncbi:MAG: FixH family protein [Acidobacteriota bacterium]|nr:FixH family protein [Acidobacteriota bacterium]